MDAVMRLLQYDVRITNARLLSGPQNSHGTRGHAFLLETEYDGTVAIKSGFASGYGGEGPKGLSFVLQLLESHAVEIREFEVTEDFLERIDGSALTVGDLEKLDTQRQRHPAYWRDYVEERHESEHLWRKFPPVIPFAIIDRRIIDLALTFFADPDKKLLTGYRRLEDIIRKRSGIDEHGVKLFSEAFHGEKAKLGWKDIGESERIGRANLFVGAYMAYRNPRAHREPDGHAESHLTEFLLLNHLFILEKDAQEKTGDVADQSASKGANPSQMGGQKRRASAASG